MDGNEKTEVRPERWAPGIMYSTCDVRGPVIEPPSANNSHLVPVRSSPGCFAGSLFYPDCLINLVISLYDSVMFRKKS